MEKIEYLPKDKIPLSNEEKDVFTWLYPIIQEDKKSEKMIEKNSSNIYFYISLIFFSIILFIVFFPKMDKILWEKLIPTNNMNPFYTILKILIVFLSFYMFSILLRKVSSIENSN